MKVLGETVNKRAKHREWSWCRRKNGFSDMPLWRVVAKRLGMPVHQVIAFVHRLEEHANDAGNRGLSRGDVSGFSAEEFALALGMSDDDAARIRAMLEEPDIAWIMDGHIADFYERNRDKEDDTAPLRQRRRTCRKKIMECLAKLARLGLIESAHRAEIEAGLMAFADEELFRLRTEVVTAVATKSTITRASRRDVVTITPEKITEFTRPPVDNSGDNASDRSAGPSEDGASGRGIDANEVAELWLAGEGTRVVTEQLMENRQLAATKIARWRDQELGGNAAALVEIIKAAERSGLFGARFLNLIVDGIGAAKRKATAQGELPMPPVLASERKMA